MRAETGEPASPVWPEVWLFVRRVAHKWRLSLVGSALVAVVFLLPVLGLNLEQRWAGWKASQWITGLVGVALLFSAFFRVWKEERQARLAAEAALAGNDPFTRDRKRQLLADLETAWAAMQEAANVLALPAQRNAAVAAAARARTGLRTFLSDDDAAWLAAQTSEAEKLMFNLLAAMAWRPGTSPPPQPNPGPPRAAFTAHREAAARELQRRLRL